MRVVDLWFAWFLDDEIRGRIAAIVVLILLVLCLGLLVHLARLCRMLAEIRLTVGEIAEETAAGRRLIEGQERIVEQHLVLLAEVAGHIDYAIDRDTLTIRPARSLRRERVHSRPPGARPPHVDHGMAAERRSERTSG